MLNHPRRCRAARLRSCPGGVAWAGPGLVTRRSGQVRDQPASEQRRPVLQVVDSVADFLTVRRELHFVDVLPVTRGEQVDRLDEVAFVDVGNVATRANGAVILPDELLQGA